MPNIPAPPQFNSMMAPQFNNYDFQASSYPPAPSFNSMGIACPVPPGMSEAWIPPPTMSSGPIQPEETEEEKLKREGIKKINFLLLNTYQLKIQFYLQLLLLKKRNVNAKA